MTTPAQPSSAMVYTQGFGSSPSFFTPHYDTRAPASTDVRSPTGFYQPGQIWVYINNAAYILLGLSSSNGVTSATWVQVSDSDGPILSVVGTANQITVSTAAGVATISLPSAIIAPGSLTTTTTLAATTTVTAGTGITSTTGNITATAGAVNAGTSMTATAGDITATLGNVIINGAAKQLRIHGGAATDFIGQVTLTNGTADVLNTNIAATDLIFVTRSAKNGSTAYGGALITITAATKFNLTACKADTTTETNDQSTFDYVIIRQV